jgi:hypothetical protein
MPLCTYGEAHPPKTFMIVFVLFIVLVLALDMGLEF